MLSVIIFDNILHIRLYIMHKEKIMDITFSKSVNLRALKIILILWIVIQTIHVYNPHKSVPS